MTNAEMQDMVDAFGTMFREYMATLTESPDYWFEGNLPSERGRAREVLQAFLTWLWKDCHAGDK